MKCDKTSSDGEEFIIQIPLIDVGTILLSHPLQSLLQLLQAIMENLSNFPKVLQYSICIKIVSLLCSDPS